MFLPLGGWSWQILKSKELVFRVIFLTSSKPKVYLSKQNINWEESSKVVKSTVSEKKEKKETKIARSKVITKWMVLSILNK